MMAQRPKYINHIIKVNEQPRRKRTGYPLEGFLSRRKRRGIGPTKE